MVGQEQETLSESHWGDQQFQNVTGKFRVDLTEINHKISRHFTKSGACASNTSDHPTQNKGMGYHGTKVSKFKGKNSKIILAGMTKMMLMNGALIWLCSCCSPLGHMRFSLHNGRVSTFFLALRWYSKFNHLLCFFRSRRKGNSNRRKSGQLIVHPMY